MDTKTTVLSVSELTKAIKYQIESKFLYVCVKGEITNLKRQSSGHMYFTLQDKLCQISAVLFRGVASSSKDSIKNGDQIIAKGNISVYAPRGTYQIIVKEIEKEGVGSLLIQLHELKEKLKKKGWFDLEAKKILPKHPKAIGVVSSPTGSVIKDILNVLNRRFKGFNLILNPVKVQGIGAAQEIAAAIYEFNKYNIVDVIIIARGGGSLEDLWAFNEEIVAKEIFLSKIPIISAVGHETDTSICDYVADVRAPTPSAAAEICIKEQKIQLNFLHNTRKQLFSLIVNLVKNYRYKIKNISKQGVLQSPYYILSLHIQKVDDLSNKLKTFIKNNITQKKIKLSFLKKQLHNLPINNKTIRLKENLKKIEEHIKSLNPKNILKKGYCITLDESNNIIKSKHKLKKNQRLSITLSDGSAVTEVKEIN